MIQRQRQIADLFFFYLLGDQGKRLFTTALKKDQRTRTDALREIQEMTVLLQGHEEHPYYPRAFRSYAYRMRELGDPEQLQTQQGMQQYLTYMVLSVNPTQEEYRSSYQMLCYQADERR